MANYMAKRIHMLLTFDVPAFVLLFFTINLKLNAFFTYSTAVAIARNLWRSMRITAMPESADIITWASRISIVTLFTSIAKIIPEIS